MFTIDTNILIYSADVSDLAKQVIADLIVEAQTFAGFPIPLQTLSEFYHVVTRKRILSPREATAVITRMMAACKTIRSDSVDLINALRFNQVDGVPIFDALLLSTAKRASCTTLFSEDFQHGRDYEGIKVRNPFVMDEAELDELLG